MFQEHLLYLQKVFQQFREARLKLNPEKFKLFQKEVRYLRHTVSPEGITTNPEKTKAISEWPTSKNKHEVRSFMGLCTYYRCFICSFAKIAILLTKLKQEKQAFQWTPEVEATFQMEALCIAPILAYQQPREGFVVDTDGSNVGIGVVPSQVLDRWECVIAYYSKILNKAEKLLHHPVGTTCNHEDS
jgi:hypothetical protein